MILYDVDSPFLSHLFEFVPALGELFKPIFYVSRVDVGLLDKSGTGILHSLQYHNKSAIY